MDFKGGGGIVTPEEKAVFESNEDVDKIEVLSADELVTEKFQSIKKIVDEAKDEFFLIGVPGPFTFEYVTFMRGK